MCGEQHHAPEMVFLHRCLCLHGFTERETLVDLNAEGAGLDQGR